MDQQTHRLRLRVAAKIMVYVAMLAVAYVILSVVFSSDKSTRVMATQIVDISRLEPGDTQIELWEGRPVLIYRRTNADIAALQSPEPRLQDAESKKSKQPSWAKNKQRSREAGWFVSIGVGTDFSCPIANSPASTELFMGEAWTGGFVDECRGSRYDRAGRVYKGQYADENLIVPPYVRKDDVLILGG